MRCKLRRAPQMHDLDKARCSLAMSNRHTPGGWLLMHPMLFPAALCCCSMSWIFWCHLQRTAGWCCQTASVSTLW
jgi:hypothetical protein